MKITERGEYVYLELLIEQVPELHALRNYHRPHKQIYATSNCQEWQRAILQQGGNILFSGYNEQAITVRPDFNGDWLALDSKHPSHILVSGNALFITESGKPEWLSCQLRVQLRAVILRVRTADLAMARYRGVIERVLTGPGAPPATA